MTLGRGARIYDEMSSALWSLYFIQEQVYQMTHALIHQDNKSTILLETNGKMSSSKGIKQIKLRYFFEKTKLNQRK